MRLRSRDTVFVSSPMGGLRPYRAAVAQSLERIDLQPVLLDKEWGDVGKRARNDVLVDKVCKRVKKCSAVVVLLGSRRGLRVRGTDYTLSEHEIIAAEQAKIPVFAYVTKGSEFFANLNVNPEAEIENLILSQCEEIETVASSDELKTRIKNHFTARITAETESRKTEYKNQRILKDL